jgi:hypothetical protein
MDITLVWFLSYIHSGDFKADLPTIVLLVLVAMIAFPLFVNYCESFEDINRTKRVLLLCSFPMFAISSLASTFMLMYQKAVLEYQIDGLTMSSNSSDELAQKIYLTMDDLEKKNNELKALKLKITKKKFWKQPLKLSRSHT